MLTAQLMTVMKSIQIPSEGFEQVSAALRALHEDKKRMRDSTIATMEAEIEKYQTRIEKIYEDYLDEKIPETLYQRKFNEYREAQKKLQNKRLNIEQVDDEYYGTVTHLLRLSKDAPRLFKQASIEQKRSLIDMVLSNLRLDGEQLLWELKKPFDSMAFCSKNSNWLTTIEEVITQIKRDCHSLATS